MDVKEFILKNVKKHPQDIVAFTMKHFGLSRPTVHEHLKKLIEDGRIKKQGTTRSVHYELIDATTWIYPISEELSEDDIWLETIQPRAKKYPENILRILHYGVTEMINNVIDHSGGKILTVRFKEKAGVVSISVQDDGIGIFKKIARAKKLTDLREAVLHLSKGKFTTDPARHSGEGIFFTSRAFDDYIIMSDQLSYITYNREEDWFLERKEEASDPGTTVYMKINLDSDRQLVDVFRAYQDPESQAFDKTTIVVKLSKLPGESCISRSQAKRILTGLERFKTIILDFKDVKTVGQAFVDEIFRVYKNGHPDTEINYINENEEIKFMITRGISTSRG